MSVVTRFAPSPTGFLHIGGARTALFNWALARRLGGRFVLRIEDTDEARNRPEWTEGIISALEWLGISSADPTFEGPYMQSDNAEAHPEAARSLAASGRAYWCAMTPEEIAEQMDMPADKVEKILKLNRGPISLQTPVGDEEDSHLGDFIEDKNAVQPLDAAIHANLRETTTRVLASLTAREERVLRMRFGIGMNTDHTLEEVGQQFSVTRERIRQIEAKALRKLKHPSRSRKLRSFLEN